MLPEVLMVVVRLPTGVVSLRSSREADRGILRALKHSIRPLEPARGSGAIPVGIVPIDHALGGAFTREYS